MTSCRLPAVQKGTFHVIRVDGTEEVVNEPPTIRAIQRAIGCDTLDTVTIKHSPRIVMLVDDTGMIDRKPVNGKATALYRAICKPGTVYQIHGDVAIAHDTDFA